MFSRWRLIARIMYGAMILKIWCTTVGKRVESRETIHTRSTAIRKGLNTGTRR